MCCITRIGSGNCTPKHFLKIVCSFFTIYIIIDVLISFLICKPTFSSVTQEEIGQEFSLKILVCPEHGYEKSVLSKYGYESSFWYSAGVSTSGKLVGWSGINGSHESERLMEEIISLKNISTSPKLYYLLKVEDQHGRIALEANYSITRPIYPFGRCLNVFPPSVAEKQTISGFILKDYFNNSISKYTEGFKMIIMDQFESSTLKYELHNMIGDSIHIHRKETGFFNFFVKVSKLKNMENDPHYKCKTYSPIKSYDDCLTKLYKDNFLNCLSCIPPWLIVAEEKKVCKHSLGIIKK